MKQKTLSRFLAIGAVLLFMSCGLDTYIFFYPVNQYTNWPSEINAAQNYFEFKTRDADNASNVYFKGFEILYRIYNNSSDRATDVSAITSYNANNPALAYSYLLNTKNYVRMNAEFRIGSYPLIPAASSDRVVTIRLVTYGDYVESITVDGTSYGLALRTIDGLTRYDSSTTRYMFDYDEIKSGDSDTKYGTWDDSANKKWYVQAFVLAYGYDESYKAIYSEAYNIGYVTISEAGDTD